MAQGQGGLGWPHTQPAPQADAGHRHQDMPPETNAPGQPDLDVCAQQPLRLEGHTNNLQLSTDIKADGTSHGQTQQTSTPGQPDLDVCARQPAPVRAGRRRCAAWGGGASGQVRKQLQEGGGGRVSVHCILDRPVHRVGPCTACPPCSKLFSCLRQPAQADALGFPLEQMEAAHRLAAGSQGLRVRHGACRCGQCALPARRWLCTPLAHRHGRHGCGCLGSRAAAASCGCTATLHLWASAGWHTTGSSSAAIQHVHAGRQGDPRVLRPAARCSWCSARKRGL